MNKDMYEERVKRNIDTDNKSSESVYADKADKDRESAFDDISQAKLPESMANIDENELLIEFAIDTSKETTLTAYYLFYEFFQYVKYLGVTMDKAATNMVCGLVKEYVQTHNVTKETARDRAKFITNFLYKQGIIPSIEQPEFDPFTEGQRIVCIKLPKFIEDLDDPNTNKFKHEFYKKLRDSGIFTMPDTSQDTLSKTPYAGNSLRGMYNRYNIHDEMLYLQLNDIAAEDASEFNDILHDDLNEQCEWEELLSEKDLRKRIKYAKSYQERRYYQQLLGSRANPGRRKRNKKKKK